MSKPWISYVDPATINAATFKLHIGSAEIAGTVTYSVATRAATFTPSAPLPEGTLCTATVLTGVQDLAGNALAPEKVWTFTTRSAPGVVLTESNGTTQVAEAGATDGYAIVLTAQPGADVTITPSPDAQVSVFPVTLTFTTLNWNVPEPSTKNGRRSWKKISKASRLTTAGSAST